jgi:hypothetical protein
MTLSEQELYELVFNRSISEGLIKDTQIMAGYHQWVVSYLPAAFLLDIADNEEFIYNYIKPIWAWGILYSNFNYISTSITDKGVIQLLVENVASVLGTDKLLNTKNEILNLVNTLLNRLDDYCTKQKDAGVAGFENYDGLLINPSLIYFAGRERYNQNPY